MLQLQVLPDNFSVCQLDQADQIDWQIPFSFYSRTDSEVSLVCPSNSVPKETMRQEDDWRCLRVEGQLDFGLTGILSGITQLLAEKKIAIFAISTFNTDYILVKQPQLNAAAKALRKAGYIVGPC